MKRNFFTTDFCLSLFLWLTFAFVAFTVIGTVTHELGHYTVARILGYDAEINYSSTHWYDNRDQKFFKAVWKNYKQEIRADKPFPGKAHYDKLSAQYKRDSKLILLGGPVQTMLTGTIGLILMILLRKKYFSSERLSSGLWIIIFLTLFWLREAANFFVGLAILVTHGPVSSGGDEFRLSRYLNLPPWTLSIITAIIAIIILILVIFRFIPVKQRLTFIFSGIVGGITGYVFWLILFGKYIMP